MTSLLSYYFPLLRNERDLVLLLLCTKLSTIVYETDNKKIAKHILEDEFLLRHVVKWHHVFRKEHILVVEVKIPRICNSSYLNHLRKTDTEDENDDYNDGHNNNGNHDDGNDGNGGCDGNDGSDGNDDEIILIGAMKGTDRIVQWLSNLYFQLKPFDLIEKSRVHTGLYGSFTNNVPWRYFKHFLLSHYGKQKKRYKKIVFTGHSRGAAMACFTMIHMLTEFANRNDPSFQFEFIGFGMPLIGDEALSQWIIENNYQHMFHNYIFELDPAPFFAIRMTLTGFHPLGCLAIIYQTESGGLYLKKYIPAKNSIQIKPKTVVKPSENKQSDDSIMEINHDGTELNLAMNCENQQFQEFYNLAHSAMYTNFGEFMTLVRGIFRYHPMENYTMLLLKQYDHYRILRDRNITIQSVPFLIQKGFVPKTLKGKKKVFSNPQPPLLTRIESDKDIHQIMNTKQNSNLDDDPPSIQNEINQIFSKL